jgi:hypothetical protein
MNSMVRTLFLTTKEIKEILEEFKTESLEDNSMLVQITGVNISYQKRVCVFLFLFLNPVTRNQDGKFRVFPSKPPA